MLCCAGLVLLASSPALCQVETTVADTGGGSGDNLRMQVPPPVNGQSYPTDFAGETEANFWRFGLVLSSAWSSDVSGGAQPVSDISYSFWPTFALNQATPQLHLLFSYSPGFTVYQRTSGSNQADHNASVNLQYRISPNMTLSLQDTLNKTSNIFNQPNPVSATPVSGSLPPSGVGVIAPLADQISNATGAQLTYQVGATSMLGFGGNFAISDYLNSQQVPGLYNSRSAGGSVFYSRRLGEKYYLGVNYQYADILASQTGLPGTHTQTQTAFAFLSVYLKPTFSISISGGPQHYASTQPPYPAVSGWSPMMMVSAAWQGQRTTLAASFSRVVSGGGGLGGAFHSTSFGVSANWRVSRNWNAGLGAAYGDSATLTPLFLGSSAGRTISGTVSAQRALGEHAGVQFGYSWSNQNYHNIQAIASAPNVNRVFVSLNYQFTKPLQK